MILILQGVIDSSRTSATLYDDYSMDFTLATFSLNYLIKKFSTKVKNTSFQWFRRRTIFWMQILKPIAPFVEKELNKHCSSFSLMRQVFFYIFCFFHNWTILRKTRQCVAGTRDLIVPFQSFLCQFYALFANWECTISNQETLFGGRQCS